MYNAKVHNHGKIMLWQALIKTQIFCYLTILHFSSNGRYKHALLNIVIHFQASFLGCDILMNPERIPPMVKDYYWDKQVI